jgi:hypothetical protein
VHGPVKRSLEVEQLCDMEPDGLTVVEVEMRDGARMRFVRGTGHRMREAATGLMIWTPGGVEGET